MKLINLNQISFGIKFKMRLSLTILLISLMQANASTYSQNKKITLDLKNVSIEKVFEEIELNSKFVIF